MTNSLEADIQALVGTPLEDDDRETLQYLRNFVAPLITVAADQTAATSRWLLASLLAVNGGAILAVLSSQEVGHAHKRWAIVAWLIGIVLALGSGFVAMHNGQRGIRVASDIVSEITKTLAGGVWRDIRFQKQEKELKRQGEVAIRVGLLALLAFVTGVILAAT